MKLLITVLWWYRENYKAVLLGHESKSGGEFESICCLLCLRDKLG